MIPGMSLKRMIFKYSLKNLPDMSQEMPVTSDDGYSRNYLIA